MTRLELLAPARDAEIAMQAILHGADAVYMGGPSHGARAAASNTIDDIARVVEFAHKFHARVYVTLNTLVYEPEIEQVERLVREYHRIGVDALIVQDMGLLRMDLPPISLHASTQCDIRSAAKGAFLAAAGFSQLVLPREFTLDEIRQMRQAVPDGVALEAFVHGALCVSYSGDCQASYVANGRSANRGECAQMCRMAYDLVDGNGQVLLRDKHLLSLRDLCRLDDLEALALAGISSFKIEGRLKDASYVKTVVGAYRRELDRIIAAHPDKFAASSLGRTHLAFTPDVNRAFNRGFTSYFLYGNQRVAPKMASFDTPKSIGQKVGKVVKSGPGGIIADLSVPLANGDGLGYFDESGRFAGFRLNKIEGNRLFPASPVALKPGTLLYRNRDAEFDAVLSKSTAIRTIPIDMALESGEGLRLKVACAQNPAISYTATLSYPEEKAKSPQAEQRRRILGKLGGTNFDLSSLADTLAADLFIPASALADLRRASIAGLEKAIAAGRPIEERGSEDKGVRWPVDRPLTYHDNVANSLAERVYLDHGAAIQERAIECQKPSEIDGEKVVMTTRYCLRRELGACLRDPKAKKLSAPLSLRNKAASYRLDFDCASCQMRLLANPKKL